MKERSYLPPITIIRSTAFLMRSLTVLLKKHEEILDLTERKATIDKVLSTTRNFSFAVELQARQLHQIEEQLKRIGTVTYFYGHYIFMRKTAGTKECLP